MELNDCSKIEIINKNYHIKKKSYIVKIKYSQSIKSQLAMCATTDI